MGPRADRCVCARAPSQRESESRTPSGSRDAHPPRVLRSDGPAAHARRDDAFVRDKSPGRLEKLVDRLLASPQYGERWAQHWLDVVRFAETDGFEYDTHRHDAWRYRDYVIRAFNDDKPYDQFLREQLAGDEIDPQERGDR